MLFKLLTVLLVLLLAAESLFMLMNLANRLKPVDGRKCVVAFDTETGQLYKTLRTKSAAEICRTGGRLYEQHSQCGDA